LGKVFITSANLLRTVLDASFNQLGTFSPTTNWEKVFGLGNKINKELELSEKDIANEVITYRKKSKH